MRYKITLSYDGTDYAGWQVQPNAISIQETVEKHLATILRAPHRIVGAGRTDSGVHALEQVAHFDCESDLDCSRTLYRLNSLLPKDIRILSLEKVDADFHAQRSALQKIYHYHLWLDRVDDPFLAPYHLHVHGSFSIPLLEKGALEFIGKRDFASLANCGGSAKTSVRTIFRIDVVPQRGGVRLEFEGDGFLYKMVRNIVGVLLEVANEKRKIETIRSILDAKDRRASTRAAPAHPLFLVKVKYP